MSQLDPELKQLLRAARDTLPVPDAPLGFATRIVARADLRGGASTSSDVYAALRMVNWIAVLLILCGAAYWQSQRRAPMAGQFAQAAQFVVENMSP
jgi:hypothetical protein